MNSAVRGLQMYHGQLMAQRADLDARLQLVAQALAAMGGRAVGRPAVAAGRVGRPPGRRGGAGGWRPGSLKAHIADVLSGGGIMAVKDITSGVMKSGYKTKNKTLAKSVGIALTEMKGVAKVGRGRFHMK